MNKYLLYNDTNGTITQLISCPENEISMYGNQYIICPDDFEFDTSKVQKVVNGVVVSEDRTDEQYLNQVFKEERQRLVNSIEVEYQGNMYQGDELSQDRISRAINGLPNDSSLILWKTKSNSTVNLTRVDLKEILFLAGEKQTLLWIRTGEENGN